MSLQEKIDVLKKLKEKANESKITSIDYDQAERVLLRLDSNNECSECKGLLEQWTAIFDEMSRTPLAKRNKSYEELNKKTLEHMRNSHKLVTEGYYAGIYMAIGVALSMPIGIVFSQTMKQNAFIGIGLPIGVAIGYALGASADEKAKKAGLVI